MMKSMESMHSSFYLQYVKVSSVYKGIPRLDVFREFCDNKKVLHIGCAGYPLTDPANNIHVALAPHCERLDGYDLHTESYQLLMPYVKNGRFLPNLENLENYDIVIIPEVLEHIGNVEGFLGAMAEIPSKRFVLTVPDLYQCFAKHFEFDDHRDLFAEAVHPDHNHWYSPYTIANTIKKYTSWKIEEIYWFNNISLLVSCSSKK